MQRLAMERLKAWKEKRGRKPLIIRGARQVGKTWLMKAFGAAEYAHTVYVNFDRDERMRALFDGGRDVARLIAGLELYAGHRITPEDTLLIFDEVQEAPNALASLKYFDEDAPAYHIVCAGSLLGVALHQGTSFPVGKVEFLDLYPLSFTEFLLAMGQAPYAQLLTEGDLTLAAAFRQDLSDLLKRYYYVGGMPEAVRSFAEDRDYAAVREIQARILAAYEQDFSKHAPAQIVPRIRMLWNSIPAQLARENKKFLYGLVKEGARAKDYEMAMLWLTDCGLLHKVHRVTAPHLPLRAYEDPKAFKLFLLDVGLLSCMTGLRQDVLLDGNDLFQEFKGALTEQYVLEQLKTLKGLDVYYWTAERATAEVDFVVDDGQDVIPIEVKAETNLQAKSLKVYREKYQPRRAVRTSMADYRQEDRLTDLPLWAVEAIGRA